MIATHVITTVIMAGLRLAGCQSTSPTLGFPPTTPASATVVPASCHVVDGRADIRCTPGALNPDVTQATIHSTICVPGWTTTIRPPAAFTNLLKTSQMQQYGETGPPSAYEEDHLIPLEAGGSPTDPRNLWPEPLAGPAGAHTKDHDENTARRDICAGRSTLAQAQQRLLAKWTHS